MLLELVIALVTIAVIYWLFLRPAKPLASQDVSRFKPTAVLSSANTIKKIDTAKKPASATASSSDAQVKILFGSQTGTAEDFGSTLSGECEALGLSVELIDLEDYDVEQLARESPDTLLLFMQATYGEGEPTDNAKDFWESLVAADELDLSSLSFGVFGLGNSTYEHYNWFGRQTKKRLAELGAKEAVVYGEGDDDSTLEDDFAAWRKKALPMIAKFFGVASDAHVEVQYKFRTRVVDATGPREYRFSGKPNKAGNYDLNNPAYADILVNRELHSEHSDRSCRHVEIKLPAEITYQAGDHLGVYPHNDDVLVAQVLKRLDIDPERVIRLESTSGETLVGPMTTTQVFRTYLDFYSTVPRKSLLEHLARYVTDAQQAKRFSSYLGDKYRTHIQGKHMTFLDLLQEFSSLTPPLEAVLEFLPRLQPRYYSISSAPIVPDRVHITVAVVNFETPMLREHKGVCSTWLAATQTRAAVFVRTSPFKMPDNEETPVIMIGPGTGLAPFRGFLQQRASSPTSAPYVLFFGCRKRSHDYIYQEELERWHQDGIVQLHTAFSRDQETKDYVQHRMKAAGAQLWQLIQDGAKIYICGDANQMAKDVREQWLEIFEEHGQMSRQQAEQYLEDLSAKDRLMLDTWS